MTRRRRFLAGAVSTATLVGVSGCTQGGDSAGGTGRVELTPEDKNITISRDESTEINITVENVGGAPVSRPINVSINGEPNGDIDLQLEPDEQTEAFIEVGPLDEDELLNAGVNNITMSSADDRATTTVSIKNPPCYNETFVLKRVVTVDASTLEFVIANNHSIEDGLYEGVDVYDVKVVRSDCTMSFENQDNIPVGEPVEVEGDESLRVKVNAGVGPDDIKAVKITWDSFKPGLASDGKAGGTEEDVCLAQVDDIEYNDDCESYGSREDEEESGPDMDDLYG